ncbi:MAG: hypothetical protein IPM81_22760 [Saprospirales bacterium]|nr:hypothetical protein [Saprospirales bacterium]
MQQPATVVSTITSGASALVTFNGGFAPTSGNGIMNLVEVTGMVNQTGGANGKVRMMYLAANVVNAPNLFALETVGGYSLIGDGAVFPEVMPRLAVVGLGNTTSTNAFGAYNTTGTPCFCRRRRPGRHRHFCAGLRAGCYRQRRHSPAAWLHRTTARQQPGYFALQHHRQQI